MAKPKPKRIPSDTCAVRIDGEVSFPHEGEWVELTTMDSVGELRARVAFARMGAELDAVEDGPQANATRNGIYEHHQGELCRYLARRVLGWDWTDDGGAPLRQPRNANGEPDGLLELRADELFWLLNATAAETEEDRKNG